MIQILHRYTREILYTSETAQTIAEAVIAATKAKANLHGADLRGANLGGANLHGADLREANLREADLYWANLHGADLRGANLREADLYWANLGEANLRGANLREADLREADLGEANLRGANLGEANLRGANLREADLHGADLRGAKNATLVIAHTRILPDGDLIGWKRCNAAVLVKLRIPADAKRSHAMGRKCRAEYADDLGHYTLSGDPLPDGHEAVTDTHGPRTVYRKGERITADSWDEDWMHECSHGIHFWITREEAAVWD